MGEDYAVRRNIQLTGTRLEGLDAIEMDGSVSTKDWQLREE